MSPTVVAVAVLGSGPIAQRLAAGIDGRADLRLAGRGTAARTPPGETDCVVYAPTLAEIAGHAPEDVLPGLLRAGHDVVSVVPIDGRVPVADLLDACRAGHSTFHATGAFQTTVAARLTRSLAEVSRDIRRVDLEEELALPAAGVYPWDTLGHTGIGAENLAAAEAAAATAAGYYAAGLRVLDEAVFRGAAGAGALPVVSVRVVTGAAGLAEKVIVDRELGDRLSYRSTWFADTGDGAPLRYRLATTTDSGKGATTVEFHPADGAHPADHLTAVAVLEAIVPVHESDPGIAHRDLSITCLRPDDRLAG